MNNAMGKPLRETLKKITQPFSFQLSQSMKMFSSLPGELWKIFFAVAKITSDIRPMMKFSTFLYEHLFV